MKNLRYPSIPLVTVDPYLSLWSACDKLYDDVTRHWTGRRHNMVGLVSVDEETYRFMGKVYGDNAYNSEPPAIPQTSVKVYPMRTVYTFENEKIRLTLTFMTPLLTNDLRLMSRPVSYVDYKLEALDGCEHKILILFGLDCAISVNELSQKLTAGTTENGIFCGRGENDVLCGSGDDRNIQWGYLHLFSPDKFSPNLIKQGHLRRFMDNMIRGEGIFDAEELKLGDEYSLEKDVVYITLSRELSLKKEEKGQVLIGYDDIHSIMYFNKPIDAYYKKDGDSFSDACKKAISEYESINEQVLKAEKELTDKAKKISDKYCDIVSLAYRQAIAAHKLTWDGEEIQFLSKECYSNGCIGTLDVTYPSIPLFLMTNPTLVEGMMNPIFKYADSNAWEFDFAPHDVGQYPLANGQVYGIDKKTGKQQLKYQMPVEECGNAILTVNAICHYKNDMDYFIKHRETLEKWVKYLVKYGLDPENQLCTDDFAGHLAHNCNLAAKAIMGITAFGKMLEKIGEDGNEYIKTAKEYAKAWEEKAFENDHYLLAYGSENTWSIKYNLVWDKIFGWGIFSDKVYKTEVEYYLKKINKYGLPLDSRSDYTKSDWQLWSVRLYENKEYTDKIVNAMWDMLESTPDRVPFTDWYFTSTPKMRGFQNRTVQGGLFIPML